MSDFLRVYKVTIKQLGNEITELYVAVSDVDSALAKVRSYAWGEEIDVKQVKEVGLLSSVEGLYE